MFDAYILAWMKSGLRRNDPPKRHDGWLLVLLILAAGVTGCRWNTPSAQDATPTQAQSPAAPASPPVTSYPGPTGEVNAPATGYPAPELAVTNTTGAYPGPQQSQASPPTSTLPPTASALPSLSPTADLPDATPLVTDASAGSYPAPQAQITLTPTALGYPGPESTPSPQSPTLLGAATSSPYPGPAPTITPLQIASQTLVSTRIAAGTASATVIVETPTPTLSPTVVRTIFQASNPADFRLVSDQYQLITFYATWAPDSDVMAPVILNLAGRYKNRINFVYLNLDDAANSIFKEMLRSQLPPAFFLLDPQGNVIDYWFGRVSLQEMDNVLRTFSP